MKSLFEYISEASNPYKEEQKFLEKGKKYWEEAVKKANKKYQKLFNRNVDPNVWGDEIWEVIRKTFSTSEIIKIYHWLDYIRTEGEHRYTSVERYLDGEKHGECPSLK